MAAPDQRARVLDISDRLIELYTSRSEAADEKDWPRLCELQEEIIRTEDERNRLLAGASDERSQAPETHPREDG
jgi:hypothetical protein